MKMAVLLSGSGRTLDNFHERIVAGTMQGSIEVVVSNVEGVLGLTKAEKYGYPAFTCGTNAEINDLIEKYDVKLILLAGYLKLYTPPESLKKNVINIHPSLIPSFCGAGFYGMHVHRAVKNRGVTITGCTVHFANELYDDGPIVVQHAVPVDDNDTPHDIADRVFAEECEAFPEAVNRVHEKGTHYFWDRIAKRNK